MRLRSNRFAARFEFILALGIIGAAVAGVFVNPCQLSAQKLEIIWSDQEKPILEAIHGLRSLADDVRAAQTLQLALDIRALPAGENKLILASGLANLSTEGDFGHDTLQEVATTLAAALTEHPAPEEHGGPAGTYLELAQLVSILAPRPDGPLRYEHVQASLDSPEFAKALAQLKADDQKRQEADFTLSDLQGKSWKLRSLKGKVVLVNFWATWCPPCRKEMPDLDALYKHFRKQGLVILAISDEDAGKVKPFITEEGISYPVLLDPGRKVSTLFNVNGIPKTFIYDRSGKLVTESIDMRTRKQFLGMLAQAGLK